MKLHSPQFEQALHWSVKQRVRSSPKLRRESKQSRPARSAKTWMFRLFASVGVAAAAVWIARFTNHPVTSLAVVNLWVFGASCFHAQRLWQHLHKSTDLPALFLLPVSDSLIFQWEFQKFLQEVYPVFLDAVAGLSALCCVFHFPLLSWLLVIPVASLLCATCIGLALLCAVWMPRIIYQMVVLSGIVLGFIIFFAHDTVGIAVLRLFDSYATTLNIWLPSGWPLAVFQSTVTHQWILLATFPLIFVVISTIKDSRRRLAQSVGFREAAVYEAPDMILADEPFQDRVAEKQEQSLAEEKPHRVGLTTIQEFIETRQFLALPQWRNAGWFERWLWRWLNDREKKLVEFVFPHGFAVSRAWWKIYRNLLITMVATFVLGKLSPVLQVCVLASGLFITCCQVLYQMQSGSAFRSIFCSGVSVPIYAAFSIGFRELASTLFKCSAIQLPLLVPFAALVGAGTEYFFEQPVSDGLLMGYKAGLLFFAARYITLMLGFSAGTNDNLAFHVRTLVMFLFLIVSGLIFLLLTILSFTVPCEAIDWIFPLLAMLHGYLVFRIYGWFYHRNRFDLMRAS